MLKLSPSILSADFSILGEQVAEIERCGTPYLHIDVMDGHFVPNISLGIPVIQSIRKKTNLIFDVHLMISEPEKYIDVFAEAGADIISFHLEATNDPLAIIRKIRKLGKSPAIVVKMETPIESVFALAKEVDMILLMSIQPGFGGQKLRDSALQKASELRAFLRQNNLKVDIQMDGGIKIDNLQDVIDAGVNVIVMGSAIFSGEGITSNIQDVQAIFQKYGDVY